MGVLKGENRTEPKEHQRERGHWGLQAGRGEVYSGFLGERAARPADVLAAGETDSKSTGCMYDAR